MEEKKKKKTGIKRKNDDTGVSEKKQKIMVNRKHVEEKEKVEVVNQVVEVPVEQGQQIVHTRQLVEGNFGEETEDEGANFVQSNTEVTMQQVEERQNTYQQFELSSGTQVEGQQEYEVAIIENPPADTTKRYARQNRQDRTVCQDLNEANSSSNTSGTFKRRPGTAAIRGHFYESKLISLILYRAKHDDSIEQFQLASNMDNKQVGDLDDICFRAKVKGLTKPLIAFIQSKHKDDSEESPKVVLMKYFLSYLKIREQFKSRHDKNSMFHSKFQDTECFFIVYTNGKQKHSLDDDAVENEHDLDELNKLIATGGIAKRPYKHKDDVAASLCEKHAEIRTVSLAKRLATFMGKEMSLKDLQSDKNNIIFLYHVFLGQTVFDVSEIKPQEHRVATFRKDFFNAKDKYLTEFKMKLFQEMFDGRKMKKKIKEIKEILSEYKNQPTAAILSKLIGTVVKYNEGKLELVKKYSKYLNQQFLQTLNCQSTVNEAIELAAKDIVTKVPVEFGNKDLKLLGSKKEKDHNITLLKSRIIDLLDKFRNIVIDKFIEKDFLELDGELAWAIGNIFVPDDNTKYMKITDSCDSLEPHAKSLYTSLVNEIHNLHEYRFYFDVKNVPRFSLGPSDYDKHLAKEFLSKLLIYSKQAEENEVQELLKNNIEDYQLDHRNYFQAKTDAMCLQYHDRIQKWWMLKHQAPYLTKDSNIFEEAINSIIEDPLMSSINLLYMSKLQHFEYTFHDEAVSSLHLQDHSTTVIITKNCVLTVVKLLQHFENKNHAVLDLEYIVKLPINDRNALCVELKKTNDHKALVFVCEKLQNKRKENKHLEIIGKAVSNKKSIIITNHMTHETLQKYFPRADNIVQDDKNSLIDMSEASQKSILESTVVFQGAKLKLNLILDDESKAYVNGDVLNTIISKETIKISKLPVDRQYDEVKHLYVDRCVQQTKANTSLPLKTLFDIEDDVVLVTAEPGMGKSTLLTHLSLKTKIKHPDVWIVRVNLLEYSRQFSKWEKENTAINTLETMKFVCQVMLGDKLDGKGDNVEFELEEDNGVVNLTQCTGDQWTEFELKLFLYFYNKRNIIFVFDGFDEICPHYMHEVIKCIKTVNSHNKNHKIWVTSRSYTEIQQCLQRAFGEPYEIEHLSYSAKKEYLMKIWQFNLILKELDKLQLQNVHDFLKFVTEPQKQELQLFELPLQEIYIDAVNYIINEIKTTSIPLWTFNDNYDDRFYKLEEKDIFERSIYEDNSDKNPLHIFLRALFVINRIKDVSHSTNKWNRDVNTFTFYEQYLETKLKRIRFQGKNQMDIYNPDIRIAYEKELKEFIAKHKKMAAYAIFNQDINKLFSIKDVEEIKETIKFIEKGGEKTGLIYSVANISAIEIPIFIHMTFAEYFAVEYICDLLKHGDGNENQHQLMDFIFNVMFSASNFENIRTIFDYKMKIDVKVMSVIKDHDEVIFNLLFEQGKAHSEYLGNVQTNISEETSKKKENAHFWPPFEALRERLHNFRCLFVAIFERYINENNLSEFLDLVHGINLLSNAVLEKWDELVVCVFNKVKDYKLSSLNCVLPKNFGLLSRSRDYDEISSEEIIELIREDYLKEYNTLKENGHFQKLEWLYQM